SLIEDYDLAVAEYRKAFKTSIGGSGALPAAARAADGFNVGVEGDVGFRPLPPNREGMGLESDVGPPCPADTAYQVYIVRQQAVGDWAMLQCECQESFCADCVWDVHGDRFYELLQDGRDCYKCLGICKCFACNPGLPPPDPPKVDEAGDVYLGEQLHFDKTRMEVLTFDLRRPRGLLGVDFAPGKVPKAQIAAASAAKTPATPLRKSPRKPARTTPKKGAKSSPQKPVRKSPRRTPRKAPQDATGTTFQEEGGNEPSQDELAGGSSQEAGDTVMKDGAVVSDSLLFEEVDSFIRHEADNPIGDSADNSLIEPADVGSAGTSSKEIAGTLPQEEAGTSPDKEADTSDPKAAETLANDDAADALAQEPIDTMSDLTDSLLQGSANTSFSDSTPPLPFDTVEPASAESTDNLLDGLMDTSPDEAADILPDVAMDTSPDEVAGEPSDKVAENVPSREAMDTSTEETVNNVINKETDASAGDSFSEAADNAPVPKALETSQPDESVTASDDVAPISPQHSAQVQPDHTDKDQDQPEQYDDFNETETEDEPDRVSSSEEEDMEELDRALFARIRERRNRSVSSSVSASEANQSGGGKKAAAKGGSRKRRKHDAGDKEKPRKRGRKKNLEQAEQSKVANPAQSPSEFQSNVANPAAPTPSNSSATQQPTTPVRVPASNPRIVASKPPPTPIPGDIPAGLPVSFLNVLDRRTMSLVGRLSSRSKRKLGDGDAGRERSGSETPTRESVPQTQRSPRSPDGAVSHTVWNDADAGQDVGEDVGGENEVDVGAESPETPRAKRAKIGEIVQSVTSSSPEKRPRTRRQRNESGKTNEAPEQPAEKEVDQTPVPETTANSTKKTATAENEVQQTSVTKTTANSTQKTTTTETETTPAATSASKSSHRSAGTPAKQRTDAVEKGKATTTSSKTTRVPGTPEPSDEIETVASSVKSRRRRLLRRTGLAHDSSAEETAVGEADHMEAETVENQTIIEQQSEQQPEAGSANVVVAASTSVTGGKAQTSAMRVSKSRRVETDDDVLVMESSLGGGEHEHEQIASPRRRRKPPKAVAFTMTTRRSKRGGKENTADESEAMSEDHSAPRVEEGERTRGDGAESIASTVTAASRRSRKRRSVATRPHKRGLPRVRPSSRVSGIAAAHTNLHDAVMTDGDDEEEEEAGLQQPERRDEDGDVGMISDDTPAVEQMERTASNASEHSNAVKTTAPAEPNADVVKSPKKKRSNGGVHKEARTEVAVAEAEVGDGRSSEDQGEAAAEGIQLDGIEDNMDIVGSGNAEETAHDQQQKVPTAKVTEPSSANTPTFAERKKGAVVETRSSVTGDSDGIVGSEKASEASNGRQTLASRPKTTEPNIPKASSTAHKGNGEQGTAKISLTEQEKEPAKERNGEIVVSEQASQEERQNVRRTSTTEVDEMGVAGVDKETDDPSTSTSTEKSTLPEKRSKQVPEVNGDNKTMVDDAFLQDSQDKRTSSVQIPTPVPMNDMVSETTRTMQASRIPSGKEAPSSHASTTQGEKSAQAEVTFQTKVPQTERSQSYETQGDVMMDDLRSNRSMSATLSPRPPTPDFGSPGLGDNGSTRSWSRSMSATSVPPPHTSDMRSPSTALFRSPERIPQRELIDQDEGRRRSMNMGMGHQNQSRMPAPPSTSSLDSPAYTHDHSSSQVYQDRQDHRHSHSHSHHSHQSHMHHPQEDYHRRRSTPASGSNMGAPPSWRSSAPFDDRFVDPPYSTGSNRRGSLSSNSSTASTPMVTMRTTPTPPPPPSTPLGGNGTVSTAGAGVNGHGSALAAPPPPAVPLPPLPPEGSLTFDYGRMTPEEVGLFYNTVLSMAHMKQWDLVQWLVSKECEKNLSRMRR
ncbi:hypothetical protein HK102_002630, partial [Quaeritorhiza haematococci]